MPHPLTPTTHIDRAEFERRLGVIASAKRKPRKDEVDCLRVAYWCYEVQRRLGGEEDGNPLVPYAVERQVEPQSFRHSKNGGKHHRNKWSGYHRGMHDPLPVLVEAADRQAPGTAHVLNHPFWDCLRPPDRRHSSRQMLFRQLSPEIQRLLFVSESVDGGASRREISLTVLGEIEQLAGLDALACLLLLFEDYEQQPIAFDIGCSIYRVMLILCALRTFVAIERELLEILAERGFPRATYQAQAIEFDATDFLFAVELLNMHLMVSMGRGYAPTTLGGGVRESIEVFRGARGEVTKSLFAVPRKGSDKSKSVLALMRSLYNHALFLKDAELDELTQTGSSLISQLQRFHPKETIVTDHHDE